MRSFRFIALVTTGLASAVLFAPTLSGRALAASDPSVGDVIKALTVMPGASRGSRPVVAAPVAAPVHGAPAAMPAIVAGSGAIDLNVQFAPGQAELNAGAKRTLDVLGQALTSPELASARVRIEGHTDTTGTPAANMELSGRRAAAAVAYLEQKFAIPPARLETAARGAGDLLVPTADQVNEPRNRRVHVVNISG